MSCKGEMGRGFPTPCLPWGWAEEETEAEVGRAGEGLHSPPEAPTPPPGSLREPRPSPQSRRGTPHLPSLVLPNLLSRHLPPSRLLTVSPPSRIPAGNLGATPSAAQSHSTTTESPPNAWTLVPSAAPTVQALSPCLPTALPTGGHHPKYRLFLLLSAQKANKTAKCQGKLQSAITQLQSPASDASKPGHFCVPNVLCGHTSP